MKKFVPFIAIVLVATLGCGSQATKPETQALGYSAPTEAAAAEPKPPTSASPPTRSVEDWIAKLENASSASEFEEAVTNLESLRDPAAIPIIATQTRSALVRLGPSAVSELQRIFLGRHKAINKLARKRGFNVRCRRKGSENTTCKAPGNLRFRSAMLLGDFRAAGALPMLLAQLKKPAEPSFYAPNGLLGPSDHNAILSALRAIGDPASADEILDYILARKTDDNDRPNALDVYAWVAPPGSGMVEIGQLLRGRLRGKKLADHDVQLVHAAARTYSLLVKAKGDHKALEDFAKVQRKQEIPASYLDALLVRARVGSQCKTAACYAGVLKLDDDAVAKTYGSRTSAATNKEKAAMRLGAYERALIDLAKMGSKAKGALPAVLGLADAQERIVRAAVLHALMKIGGPSCGDCRDRLTEVLEAQKDDTRLRHLSNDTRLVLQYFVNGAR